MAVKKIVNQNKETWFYDFRISGVRYRGAIPEARNKQQAGQAETKIRSEIFEGKYGDGRSRITIREFVDEVFTPWARANRRSWNSEAARLKPIVAFFGGKRFHEITPFLVEKFKVERRNSRIVSLKNKEGLPRTVASVNRELLLLNRVFTLAITNGVAVSNPCQRVKKLAGEQPRTRYLLPDEEQRLLAAFTGLRSHLRPIVVLALNTGMRRNEMLRLKWDQIDFHRNEIKATHTKTSKDRFVPMNEVVRHQLLSLRESAKGVFVFLNEKTGKPITDVKNGFRAACQEAGIKDFRFHDLRHTFGTRAADAGVALTAVASVMGHADIHTTMRYAHATDEGRRRAVEAAISPGNVVKIWSKSSSQGNGTEG